MPLHDYKCATCGKRREVFLKIEDMGSTVYCKCGQPMLRQLAAPYVRGDYPPYECPVTGKVIEGRRAHEENLKATGCRILEPGESQAHAKRLAKAEEEFDAKLEASIDEEIAKLPSEKRERLAAEMDGGLTAQIERITPNAT